MREDLINKFISRVEKLTYLHFLLFTVVCSELFTFVLNIFMSLLWYGEISLDLLVIGTVDSLVVSLMVAILLISMVRYNARIRFEKNVYEKEINERRKYEEQLKITNQIMEREISERVGTEIRLNHTLSLLKSSLESTADGLLIVGEDGKIVSYNQKFVDMWRIPPDVLDLLEEDVVLKFVVEQLKNPDVFLGKVQTLYGRPEEESFDVIEFKDGRIFERYSIPQRLDDRAVGRVWSFRDVTKRVRAEETIRQSTSLIDKTFSSLDVIVLLVDTVTNKILKASQAIENILGYRSEEVVGRDTGFLHVDEQMYEKFEKDMFQSLNSRGKYTAEFRLRHKSGRILFTDHTVSEVLDDSGKRIAVVSVIRDITERKEAEEKLRESEERFYEIFKQNEDALIMLEPEAFNVIDVNPAAEELFQYSRDELVRGKLKLFDEQECLEFMMGNKGMVDRSWTLAIDRKEYMRKDGTLITVSLRGKVMKLKESDVLFCSFRDMTEKIRLEEEEKLRQAHLIQTNKMTALGTLVSGVAHEINNPNAYILANISLLHKAWIDIERILEKYHEDNGEFSMGGIPYSEMREAIPQLIAGIGDGSRRIKNIVRNLKHFSRKDKAGLDGLVDMNSVIVDAVSMLNNQIQAYTDNLVITFGDNLPLIRGNAQQLEQVIINLIMNALQALPGRDCKVSISTGVIAEADAVGIEVSDEGLGMSDDVLERVTEPFFTTKFDSGGTGLGLSISYSILKEHNADLHLRSKPGEGTTVKITLPVYHEVLK